MKINNPKFNLNDKAEVELNSSDNDGLIFIPKNILLKATIENYYGKILINNLHLSFLESELQFNKTGLENRLHNLDIKLLDRYIFRFLSDKSGAAYSPYLYFPEYDFSVFEKGRRPSNLDWAMFSSLYVFSCNVLPISIKVELSLAKFLRISEENFKRYLKKIPKDIFRKSGHIEIRGGDISFNAENIIKEFLKSQSDLFDEHPFLKFYSDPNLA